MSEIAELLRQRAREEAAERAQRWATARKTTGNWILPSSGPVSRTNPVHPGETACFKCGTRTSIGCRHHPKGTHA